MLYKYISKLKLMKIASFHVLFCIMQINIILCNINNHQKSCIINYS